jgi:hypothetical protein
METSWLVLLAHVMCTSSDFQNSYPTRDLNLWLHSFSKKVLHDNHLSRKVAHDRFPLRLIKAITATMQFPWFASRSNSDLAADPEAGGVPLEDMPRQSTETQRRNGFRQSNLPDHGERIIEGIKNGK